MERGIISNIGSMTRTGNNSVSFSPVLSDNDINYYLLYWDKIVIPTNNILHIAIKYEHELQKNGILSRPYVGLNSWSTDINHASFDPFVIAQSVVANNLIGNDKSIDWTLHQLGDELIVGNEQRMEFQSLRVELLNCLPVPNGSIHFEQLLNFKEKRKDELLELHSTMDELYLEIINSPDKDFATRKVVEKLKRSINDLDSLTKSKFKSTSKYNFTAELNLSGKDLSQSLAAGAISDFYTNGFTVPIFTAAAGILSLVKIKANKTVSVEKSKDEFKLSYLAKASKKGIIQN